MPAIDFTIIVTMYLAIMTIIGFTIMGADKSRAQKNEYRISENTLWGISILGGAIGTFTGMKKFRHKTKHASFKYGLPVLATAYAVILLLLWL
ncbi:DUF1294 domain-containing protein [Jeotgalibacillus campisalis]|uniref:DUF1294 domain-containing protein n=1 Tax=Jeotgalibacillus campisalis TaxID=220754 RepID=A0A0C2RWY2_9BACL|nr:DUF1294 domain-containing protein [Jeotgalibacillus campisalis]KIL46279.1 hypothetical protein KR50_29540 [Jeotgalibacillus campisalis]